MDPVRAAARSTTFFILSALTIITACAAIVRSHLFAVNPDMAAFGVTFDLTITMPLLYWFFVVRSGKASALTLAPVFIAGTVLAAFVVPRGHQQFLKQLEWFAVPVVELLLIVALVRSKGPRGRVLEVVASELNMFRYALFSWRRKPEEVEGHAFTVHERSGWATVLACILVLVVAESIGMHLLIATMWKPKAAWVWTFFDLWAICWLLGDYHALRLRRSSIDSHALHLRYGMRWSVSVPLEQIVSVEEIRNEADWKRKDVLKVAMLEDPRWLITFAEPVTAVGLAGLRKTIRGIALLPDDEETIGLLLRHTTQTS
jgi:hypothetical protein